MHHLSIRGGTVHSGISGTVENGIVVQLEPKYSLFECPG